MEYITISAQSEKDFEMRVHETAVGSMVNQHSRGTSRRTVAMSEKDLLHVSNFRRKKKLMKEVSETATGRVNI
eukprot:116268-Amphidinium_carterae.1